MAQTLAINGGTPVRTKPFPPWPYFQPEIIEAAMEPLRTGKPNYWTGPYGREFQEQFAAYCGCRYGVAVNSGTSALQVACAAADIGPGDEVITTCCTFIASAMCVIQQNGVPIFCDVEPRYHNLDPAQIADLITPRTKAIIPVHLYGHPCDMDPIMALARQHNLVVIEDCAQAHGAEYKGKKVGSLGHIGAFSFCQDKTFTTGGEGGFVCTNDEVMALKSRTFKDHGFWEEERRDLLEMESLYLYIHHSLGFNFRMTEMQAVIGLKCLALLDSWNLPRRAANAAAITAEIGGAPGVEPPHVADWATRGWYKYPITLALEELTCDRDQFVRAVRAEGYPGAAIGEWPENYREEVFTRQQGYGGSHCPFQCPIYTERGGAVDYAQVHMPVAAELGRRTLKLQVHPTMEPSDAADIGQCVRKVAEAYAR